MIMTAVNNSTGPTGSLRVSCTSRENKENQIGCLGAGWQGKKEKEGCNGLKIQEIGYAAGVWDTDPPHSCLSWTGQHSSCGAALGLFQAKPYGEGEQEQQVRQDQVQRSA